MRVKFVPAGVLLSILSFYTLASGYFFSPTHGIVETSDGEKVELIIQDPGLTAELVFKGINIISNMAFLATNDILYLEKDNGTVNRIINGTLKPEPLLDLDVVHSDGLLGIAVSENKTYPRYVFLYLTETTKKYGEDIETNKEMVTVNQTLGQTAQCNCVYRYELLDNKLVNPKLLLELPAVPGPMHNGGEIIIGPDDNLYISVGDVTGYKSAATRTKAQNYQDGARPDGRAGIHVITQDGQPVNKPFEIDNLLKTYYAYGIRSSFGMDFDPETNNLWITENGPDYGDEINVVEPGFNSGADYVFGASFLYERHAAIDQDFDPDELVNFNGKGEYSDPEFVWDTPVGVTAIQFLDSDRYGKEYENDIFVADINHGNIYHFDLDDESNRKKLLLDEPLDDTVADNDNETLPVLFASGSGGITDLQVGPDGYLYVLSTQKNSANPPVGSIYRIVPQPFGTSP